jgi:hypothetical protein
MGEWKHVDTPVPVQPGDRETPVTGRCLIGGEPLTVKLKIAPVDGSVREHVAGELKGETIKSADRTGSCPECGAHVPLSAKGFVTAHQARGVSVPASSALTETQLPAADTGSHVGDPRSAAQRRTVEIDGAYEHGTVQIPVKGKKGRMRLDDVPATLDNVRTSLEYWRTRKIVHPGPTATRERIDRYNARCTAQSENVSTLTRRLDAMRKGAEAMEAAQSPEGLTTAHPVPTVTGKPGLTVAGMSPGPALVKGRSEKPMAGAVTVRQTGDEYVRPAPAEDNRNPLLGGTMDAPAGRERMDKESSTVPMVGGKYGYLTQGQYDELSRTQQRKYWARMHKMDAYAKSHKRTPRTVTRPGTGGVGGSSFAEGDSRETERVMRQAPQS